MLLSLIRLLAGIQKYVALLVIKTVILSCLLLNMHKEPQRKFTHNTLENISVDPGMKVNPHINNTDYLIWRPDRILQVMSAGFRGKCPFLSTDVIVSLSGHFASLHWFELKYVTQGENGPQFSTGFCSWLQENSSFCSILGYFPAYFY